MKNNSIINHVDDILNHHEKEVKKFDRTIGVSASDANTIWHEHDLEYLWKVKTKLAEPKDLSHIFRVQLGIYTELFHIEWLRKNNPLVHAIALGKHAMFKSRLDASPCLFGTPDGFIIDEEGKQHILEVKHTHENQTLEYKAQYYAPQLHVYMKIFNFPSCYISIIRGNQEPVLMKVNFNQLK